MKTYSKCMLCGVPIKWMTAEMAAKALYRAEVWVHYWGDGDYLLCDNPTEMMVKSGYERKAVADPSRIATYEAEQERLI